MNDQSNNSNIVFDYISEIEKSYDTFVEERLAEPISVKRLREIISEKEYKINHVDAMAVLQVHARNSQRILTEKFVLKLLEHESIRIVIKNRRFLFSITGGGEPVQATLIRRLIKLEPHQINSLVSALRKNKEI